MEVNTILYPDTQSSLWNEDMAKEHCKIFDYKKGFLYLHNNCWVHNVIAPDDRDYYTISTGMYHKYIPPVIEEHEQAFIQKNKRTHNKKEVACAAQN